jgi:carboxypeptidase C (cathepsin A)
MAANHTQVHCAVLRSAAGSDAPGKTPTLSDIKLNPNSHSWSRTASVLYIDSPAGTGFSYADKPSGYVTNDTATIDDLEVFVGRFYEQYRQLRWLQLYVAGGQGSRDLGCLDTLRVLHLCE